MTIKIYYFDSGPSYRQALANAREAMCIEGIEADVKLVRVESETDARKNRFVGSPTLRIGGVDIEGDPAEERGYGMGCRVYAGDGGLSGSPSVAAIRAALARAKGRMANGGG